MNSMTSAELVASLQLPEEYLVQADLHPPHQIILSPGIKQLFGEHYHPREPTYSCFTVIQKQEDASANLEIPSLFAEMSTFTENR